MSKNVMITTTDNPWNPFTQFDDWYRFDTEEKGYCTYQTLANMVYQSEVLSDSINDNELDEAMYSLADLFERINNAIEESGEVSVLPHYIILDPPKE